MPPQFFAGLTLTFLRSFRIRYELNVENILKGRIENTGNTKSEFEGGEIFSVLNGHNGLSRNPCFVGKLLLGHFVGHETEGSNIIFY